MNFLAVGAGGFAGAMLRYAIDLIPVANGTFPCKTLFINVTGAFMLGILYAFAAKNGMSELLLLFLGAGLCGGFTTFSTFAVQSARLVETNPFEAVLYISLSLLLGTGAVVLAHYIIR